MSTTNDLNFMIMLPASIILIILTIHGTFGMSTHPCDRVCKAGLPPMECHFTFNVELYSTLSRACYDCPRNRTDCNREDCISGDGFEKGLTVINRCLQQDFIHIILKDMLFSV